MLVGLPLAEQYGHTTKMRSVFTIREQQPYMSLPTVWAGQRLAKLLANSLSNVCWLVFTNTVILLNSGNLDCDKRLRPSIERYGVSVRSSHDQEKRAAP